MSGGIFVQIFNGTFKAVHGIYLYGIKWIGILLALWLIYHWTFGGGDMQGDITIFIQELDSFIAPFLIIVGLYFSVLLIIGRPAVIIYFDQVTIRSGRWSKQSCVYQDITCFTYVEPAVRGHEMPSVEVKIRNSKSSFINIISFEKDIQIILNLLVEKTSLKLDEDLEELRMAPSVREWVKGKKSLSNYVE
jgi:hypothetical protein